jgi:hypothetical protein
VLAWILVGASAVWIGYLIYHSWPDFRSSLLTFAPNWLLGAFILGLLGAATQGETFYLVLRDLAPGAFGRGQSFRLQYIAALARNLPGRFWGVAYQLAATRQNLPISHLLLAQTLLAGIAVYLAALIAATILLWAVNTTAAGMIIVLIVPLFTIGMLLSRSLSQRLAKAERRGRLVKALVTLAQAQKKLGIATALRVLAVAMLGWGLYLAAWACLGMGHPDLDGYAGLRLAAFYSLAWLLGFVALIAPAGLGVREASFLVLASEFPAPVLAMAVIVGRLWFLLNDLVLGGVAMLLPNQGQTNARA